MNKFIFKRFFLIASLLLMRSFLWAQAVEPTMDQTMRSHDKIYVVMSVCIVILIVFFLYLISIDRKISRKEKSL